MLDILSVGDSVIDIFLNIPQDNPHVKLDEKENRLIFGFGEKINLDKYVMDTGGNATNTGVGVSRLGFKTGLMAEIGNDEFSEKIFNRLKEENIDASNIIKSQKEKTSFSVVLNYNGERTIFVEHIQREHKFIFENIETKMVYLTSLGNFWEEAYEKTLNFVKNKNLILAFNPGTAQIEKRDKLVIDLIERSDYLFVNKEEAEELLYGKELGMTSSSNTSVIKKLLFGLKSLAAKNVIITDSVNGSYLQTNNDKTFHLGIVEVKVIEKTGAGDAYTAGFLGAVLNGESYENAMLWGAVNSSSVIQKIGAEEGLLKKEELLENLRNTEIRTSEI